MLLLSRTVVGDLSEDGVDEVSRFVNRANSPDHTPYGEVFSGERLEPGGLLEEFSASHLICLRREAELVGTVVLTPGEGELWVNLLSVAPEERGQGLGEQLLSEAEAFAREHGASYLTLEAVHVGKLITYYLGIGFTELERNLIPAGVWDSHRPFELVKLQRPVLP
ncbi:MAG: GNAT family N-acetyltransferase [Fimbriimonas sp.]